MGCMSPVRYPKRTPPHIWLEMSLKTQICNIGEINIGGRINWLELWSETHFSVDWRGGISLFILENMIGENEEATAVDFGESRRRRSNFAMPVSTGTEMTWPDATTTTSLIYCRRCQVAISLQQIDRVNLFSSCQNLYQERNSSSNLFNPTKFFGSFTRPK